MAIVLRRFDDERARLLGALGDLVTDQFGGEVTRTFVTAVTWLGIRRRTGESATGRRHHARPRQPTTSWP